MKYLLPLLVLLTAGPCFAQEFAAPDKELWAEMAKAVSDVPMSLTAHQQVQTILQGALREAAIRAMRRDVPKATDSTPKE